MLRLKYYGRRKPLDVSVTLPSANIQVYFEELVLSLWDALLIFLIELCTLFSSGCPCILAIFFFSPLVSYGVMAILYPLVCPNSVSCYVWIICRLPWICANASNFLLIMCLFLLSLHTTFKMFLGYLLIKKIKAEDVIGWFLIPKAFILARLWVGIAEDVV